MPTSLTDADKVIRNDTGISIANALTALSGVVRGGNENIGDAYNSSNSYSAGDYCIYENTLYKCTGATSGAWDSTKWTAVTIAGEINGKQDSLINSNMIASFNIPISGGGIGAVRYGNIAIVSMVLKAQNTVNANTQIATLVNATIVSDCYVSCYSSGGAHARLKMSGNGNIQTESALNNSDYYSATFIAIIQ